MRDFHFLAILQQLALNLSWATQIKGFVTQYAKLNIGSGKTSLSIKKNIKIPKWLQVCSFLEINTIERTVLRDDPE